MDTEEKGNIREQLSPSDSISSYMKVYIPSMSETSQPGPIESAFTIIMIVSDMDIPWPEA